MNPEPGLRIGPYELVEPIGEGGMGVVWKARDTALERSVAIKFLPEAFARDPERVARFEREAKAVAALTHPGILAIHGFGEHQGAAYAVTELLQGETLRETLHRGPLPAPRARAVALSIAQGLAAAHEQGIVHRDLKPENVFLTRDGRVKILDFGLATYVAPEATAGGAAAATRTHLTTPGAVVGTPGYFSPEQLRGLPTDTRSDVFSFGCMLFEMTAGRRPFERASAADTLAAILHVDAPAVTGVPEPLQAVIARCLEKEPAARFASARELAAALEDAGPGPARTARVAAVLAACAVLVAFGAWLAATRLGRGDPGFKPSLSSIGEAPSPNEEANESFEKALLFMRSQLDIPRARAMLDRAVRLDPGFGSALSMRALLDVIALHEGFANDVGLVYRCEQGAREVVARQPESASAHAALGAALLYLNRKDLARQELEAAQGLNPRANPPAAWQAIDDRHSGRPEASEARARAILKAVPLFWVARIMLSDALFDQGRVEEAQREAEKVLEQDPLNVGALRAVARLLIYRGETGKARELLDKVPAEARANFRVRLVTALLLAREGRREEAVAALDAETLKYAGVALFAPAQVAEVYAVLGRTDEAIEWLDRAARNGDERSDWFRRDVLLEGLRGQPRAALVLDTIDRGRR